ncbi:hypothetical protein PHSY_004114 [Pseudozyma hubeiensis SY62]|uniref:Uncharacterized protein n=1 Tax=Pseudozyma hubeiensis (strain SY62) TaxID=1305764 RepID=R9P5D9_PSEHS|nr:hypothetical protein PHSY_004114 [Pseudozyma hubeiensis SY62]GAC96534.1 hypothetical protein PHSY_004114 [Pseudozyma hubeiensis SY62]
MDWHGDSCFAPLMHVMLHLHRAWTLSFVRHTLTCVADGHSRRKRLDSFKDVSICLGTYAYRPVSPLILLRLVKRRCRSCEHLHLPSSTTDIKGRRFSYFASSERERVRRLWRKLRRKLQLFPLSIVTAPKWGARRIGGQYPLSHLPVARPLKLDFARAATAHPPAPRSSSL